MTWVPLDISSACSATNTHLTACSFGPIFFSMLVNLFGDSYDRRIQEFLKNEPFYSKPKICDEPEEYDFIIVGAGAAGCVLANRLTQIANWKVLLLEAGPEQPDVTLVPAFTTSILGSNIDWSYKTQPTENSCIASNGCTIPRGRVMGGSTSINSFIYNRGNKLDYDGWAKDGNLGWSYDEILPYFKKTEMNLNIDALDTHYHGSTGEQTISLFPYLDTMSTLLVDAFKEKGLEVNDYNADHQEGVALGQSISAYGKRVSANKAFIEPIRYTRKNLIVKPNSEAVQILVNDLNEAYGVKYINNNKEVTAISRKEVIVSSGVMGSAKLLQLSGIGPKELLEELNIPLVKDLPVGNNFQDHVTLNGLVIALSSETATIKSPEEILNDIIEYNNANDKNGPLSSNGAVSTVAFFRTDDSLPAPDIQFQTNVIYNYTQYLEDPINYDKVSLIPAAYYTALEPRAMYITPKSRGSLFLNKTDPYGPPVIYVNYLGEESDLEGLLRGYRYLLSLEDTEVFKSIGARYVRSKLPACVDYEWGTDDYVACLAKHYTSTTHHIVGTCKMGPKYDETAVVSPRLHVHGLHNLRVIDSSVAPRVMRSNPLAGTFMIAEKGADMIKEDWLQYSSKDKTRSCLHFGQC